MSDGKLPLEHSTREAARLYGTRVAIFLATAVVALLATFCVGAIVSWYPWSLLVLGVLLLALLGAARAPGMVYGRYSYRARLPWETDVILALLEKPKTISELRRELEVYQISFDREAYLTDLLDLLIDMGRVKYDCKTGLLRRTSKHK